jgi:Sec-independent protein translocase protein TatA/ribosomal protein L37E
MNTGIVIFLIVVLVVLIVFGPTILMRLFGDRAGDAIENAITRKKTSNNPQKREKLSDLYPSINPPVKLMPAPEQRVEINKTLEPPINIVQPVPAPEQSIKTSEDIRTALCKNCGFSYDKDVKFCTQCGNPVGNAVKAQQPPPAQQAKVKVTVKRK